MSQPDAFADDAARWAAVGRRDPAAGGAFVYSVRTTGVYCRPDCPARLPRRENVRFHATSADAERAGFRACRRCRPGGPSPADALRESVAAACRTIETADAPPTLAELAAGAGVSRFHFQRAFKGVLGVSPKQYAAARRADRVRAELAAGASVTTAAFAAGFGTTGRLHADPRLGMTPAAVRAGGRGETVRFAVGECSLGSVLVAASSRGVCAILLGDDPDRLARDLQDRFPHADLCPGGPDFDATVAAAVGLVEHPAADCRLPLDVRGTAFQVRVWQALRAVPPGTTATYTAIAAAIGRPTAARAVAAACGANRLAVAVPCHRVVRTDETLSGYRWGVERKAELLRRERTTSGEATGVDRRSPERQ